MYAGGGPCCGEPALDKRSAAAPLYAQAMRYLLVVWFISVDFKLLAACTRVQPLVGFEDSDMHSTPCLLHLARVLKSMSAVYCGLRCCRCCGACTTSKVAGAAAAVVAAAPAVAAARGAPLPPLVLTCGLRIFHAAAGMARSAALTAAA